MLYRGHSECLSLCDFVSFIQTQKRGDEKEGEGKGWSLGRTCAREETKENKGEIKKKAAVVIQVNEK